MELLIGCLALIAVPVISFLFVALMSWIVCTAFSLPWSWFIALGIWAAGMIVRWVIKAARGSGGE